MIVLTEEQVLIQNMAREFAMTTCSEKYKESMAEHKEKGVAPFAHNLWSEASKLGFAGITIPEEYGGMGLGAVEKAIIIEEISKTMSPLGTNIDAHGLVTNILQYSGTEEQKRKYLPLAASGKLICAGAGTDPAGSTNIVEWSDTIEEKDDHYLLNCTKFFVTNSHVAGLYAVLTKSKSKPGFTDCYLVESGTEGLETGQLEVFGKTGTYTGKVLFKNVKIPKENKIPDLGNYEYLAFGYLDFTSIVVGWCQYALDKTIAFTKQRTRGFEPLCKLQAVAHRLANMAIGLEASRALLYVAAQRCDAGQLDPKLNSMAKIQCSETLASIGLQCTAMHGAIGMDPATGILKVLIEAPGSWNGEAPNDFHRDIIANLLTGI